MIKYYLIVIGGGPAGYVGAIRAAQLGGSVAVVEYDRLGGTCLNRGCIPTKALAASAELLRRVKSAERFGVEGEPAFSWQTCSRRKDILVKKLGKGIEAHFRTHGINLVREYGTIESPGIIRAGDAVLETAGILLAPGSIPLLPGPFAAPGVETSSDVLAWNSLPTSLIIVGGGVIGCEFASILSTLGVRVTIIEMLPAILPGIDADVRQVVYRSLERSGVRIITDNAVAGLDLSAGMAAATLADGSELTAERLLAAIGRKPQLEGVGLDAAGVFYSPAGIETDECQQTNLPGVYAAGDVTGKWLLAHAASAQALVAVDQMFGNGTRTVNADAMPACIFTHPEIAVVGPGEEEWKKRGVAVRTGISRYAGSGKAACMNETEGFVKVIAREEDDAVVGVQIVGAGASSLVGEAVIAVNLRVGAKEIGRMIHPHPTLSELFMEAGESFGPGAIHG